MLTRPTVIVLGAGASAPYGFYTGGELLNEARRYPAQQFQDFIPPEYRNAAPALHAALTETLERSIDAMLETRPTLMDAGKAFMARWLLQCERNYRDRPHAVDDAIRVRRWHEMLWGACDLRSLDAFRKTPLTLVTYNYDRLVEFSLVHSLRARFDAPLADCAAALDCIGPIHVHGQLGTLPDFAPRNDMTIPFGGGAANFEGDCITAARGIKIVHEPRPRDEPFVRARDAIKSADRVIFLGFGYGRTNVERLLLTECMRRETQVYLCSSGFTPQQQAAHVRSQFEPWDATLHPGNEHQDIVQFLNFYPKALL
jgi:hypothetical protein